MRIPKKFYVCVCAVLATAVTPPITNWTLNNGFVAVTLGAGGMSSLVEDKPIHAVPGLKMVSLAMENDGWSATVRAGNGVSTSLEPWGNRDDAVTLSSSTCTSRGSIQPYGRYDNCAGVFWSCASGYTVEARYYLGDGPPRSTSVKGNYVTKTLYIASSSATTAEFVVTSVTPWQGLGVSAAGATKADWLPFKNGFNGPLEIAGFVRWGELNRGMFITVQNPFSKFFNGAPGGVNLTATYLAGVTQNTAAFNPTAYVSDGATLGLTALSAYTHVGTELNTGEYQAFTNCVEDYLLDTAARRRKTVKVNVAWDENDYQIDVGTDAGMSEYKRIIDRNAELGITHIVYEPFNSLRSSRKTATDGWGWEGSLWFSMGEQIRNGSWAPAADKKMPAEIQTMIDYAQSKQVKLMGYVYPCLNFVGGSKVPAALVDGSMDLSNREYQTWLTNTLLAFLEMSGGGGFAWDHGIFAGGSKQYAQWRAWMEILQTLRTHYPEMVMDHRQSAHAYGPWYQLAGSYTEPIAGDENPETYGVPIASLHTDHVAADNTRIVNHRYAVDTLLPPSRIPGFIFHQTERTDDNGTFPCAGAGAGASNHWLCYDMNVRDFDLLGYKYSLLSTVGTAGQNLVVTMIPARDESEYSLFPKADRDFISRWVNWTDTNVGYLRNTLPIATLPGPGLGNIDGTSAMSGDEGYLFLFNPNLPIHTASLMVDESIGLSNASVGATYSVNELFPRDGATVGSWKHGSSVNVTVGGSNARVLQLKKTASPLAALPLKTMAEATPTVYQAMPISSDFPASNTNTGGSFATTFTIPAAIPAQLAARAKAYPIEWTERDRIATWLDPNRLLGYIFIANPTDSLLGSITLTVDGTPLQVKRSYNSRGLNHSRCFLGYYFDATSISAGKPHKLELTLPKLAAGAFVGIFWQNVETEY